MIRTINNFLTTEVYGNTIQDYVVTLLIMLLIFASLAIVTYLFKKILRKIDEKHPEKQLFLKKIMDAISWPLFLVIGLSIAANSLEQTELLSKILRSTLVIVVTIYITRIIVKMINYFSMKIIKREEDKQKDSKEPVVIDIYAKILSILAWMVAFIFLLTFFNVNLGSIITGLGLASIAIAFALQNVLADIFASVSIYFDKPFAKGDFIISGTDMGFVQKIGIKSTRIKTLNGEELIISNKELTETRVRNFKNMEKRRVALNIGVQYNTPIDKLEKIPKIIEKIITKMKDVEFSRAHFKSFQESNMEFEAIYFMQKKDYKLYMDTQQKVNLEIVKAFRKDGINFAFPTRTLHLFEEKKIKQKK